LGGLAQLRKNVSSCGQGSIDLYSLLFNEVLDALMGSELVSYDSKEGFMLICDGFLFNPKFSHACSSFLYFARERDAREYARAFYNRSRSGVYLGRALERNPCGF